MTWMFLKGLVCGWLLGFGYAKLWAWINEPIDHKSRWN